MQPFLAIGCATAVCAAAIFYILWRSAERAANGNLKMWGAASSQLRQKAVEIEQLKLEITRRQEADDFQASKRSANVSKGNRTRSAKRAARLAAEHAGTAA